MRAATGPLFFFEDDRYERMPEIGEHVVLTDGAGLPLLIWRTTNLSVAPLSSVTEAFVWRDGIGDGDLVEWLRLHRAEYARQGRIYGFEMHDDIETVFVSFEVVWPKEAAHRIRLITPQLDRGIALLRRLNEQRTVADGLEAILSRIETAVFTVASDLTLGVCNPAGEALLHRRDGLALHHGRLTTRFDADARRLLSTVAEVCAPTGQIRTDRPDPRPGKSALVTIRRSDDRPSYRAVVLPVRRGHAIQALTTSSIALLFVDDPDHRAPPTRAEYCVLAFGLTPAEARLAVHLATGASLTEASDRFGVTHNTVRAQLRAIFDKTDTHRQVDLVRLLQSTGSLRISIR
jgi:DNA-binding CsgD family transcriptional regulator/uncharacterized protein YhfF